MKSLYKEETKEKEKERAKLKAKCFNMKRNKWSGGGHHKQWEKEDDGLSGRAGQESAA